MIGESKPVGAEHLVAAGDGPEPSQFEAGKGEPGIADVYLSGNRPDVPAIMRRRTIHALATGNEGLSITLPRAMTTGIDSDMPGNRFALDGGNSGTLL
jgi:hypothetical protein